MITSKRTFGVELEMGIPMNKSKAFVQEALDKLGLKARELRWDIGSDQSLKDFAYALEARSPILCGEEGEKNFREFCDYARGIGFSVNETCGTHIHLGGEDYSKRENLKEVTLGEFSDNAFVEGFTPGIAFEKNAYEMLVNSTGDALNEYIVQANNDDEFTVSCPLPDGRYSRLVRAELYVPELAQYINIVLKRSKLMKIIGEEGEPSGAVIQLGRDIGIDDIIFLSRKVKDNVGRLKNLFMFYTVFDSVLFAMLPKSRRVNNRFCKPLNYSYSYSKIDGIRTTGQFEKMWYAKSDTQDLIHSKREQKHISRRHSVNLHSLLGGIGTVEIRVHNGSLDTDELVNWIELHQYILDYISVTGMYRDICQRGAQSTDMETKTVLMCDTINMPDNLRAYIKTQIKKHK